MLDPQAVLVNSGHMAQSGSMRIADARAAIIGCPSLG